MNSKFVDWTLLILCNLMWASQPALVKIVQGADDKKPIMGPLSATTLPILMATLPLIPMVYFESRRKRRNSSTLPQQIPASQPNGRRLWLHDLIGFIAIGILGQVAAQLSITWAGSDSSYPASNMSLLMLTLPVLTAVMAFVILGEKMSPMRWFSFALAIAGALVSSGIDWSKLDVVNSGFVKGNTLVMVCCLASAFYNVYSKKLMDRYSPLQIMFGSYVILLIAMVPVTLHQEPEVLHDLFTYSLKVWIGLILLGALVYFAAMVLFLLVLSRLDAIQAGLSNYLIPVFGVALAAILFHEKPTMVVVAGGILVFASTLLVTIADARQAQAQPLQPAGT